MNWLIFAVAVLVFAGIYLLLPRPRKMPLASLGALLGLAAVAGLGAVVVLHLPAGEVPITPTVLFYSFASLAVLFAGLMITQKNPARAALSFVVVVVSVCGLFLLSAAPFLMAATIIVYAGAIVVTFLFVVMLARQEGPSDADERSREPFLATAAGAFLLGTLLVVIVRSGVDLENQRDTLEMTRQHDAFIEQQQWINDQTARLEDLAQLTAIARTLAQRADTDHADALPADQTDSYFKNWEGQLDWFRTREGNWGNRDRIELALDSLQTGIDKAVFTYPAPDEATIPETQEHFTAIAQSGTTLHAELNQEINRHRVSGYGIVLAPKDQTLDLPARNVAALSRVLFSDHLIAVEMAATLLLIAAVGAIMIGGNRSGRTR